ncbi:unnamed protein product [Orchesella dallaii]|uniref:Methyltransferase domain-containing protein n=1 Tax=Orchesella dallaii TaxID=48710 RepID=A0ABP1PTP6_9HEXA
MNGTMVETDTLNLRQPEKSNQKSADNQNHLSNGSATPKGETQSDNHAVKNGVVPVKAVEGFDNVDQTDATQYLNNYKAHKTGISHEEMVQVYTQWATDYDKDLCPGRYNGPVLAAAAMASHYSEELRPLVNILDVAAGTGRVGEELSKVGFKKIDALEPSPGMLKVLIDRNIYTKTFESAIGLKPVEAIQSDTYDSLVIAGGMGEGHIPVKAVDEMIRVVKPGGTIFIVMREEYLTYVKEYVERLEPYMNELEAKGFWKQIGRDVVPEYSFKKNGIVFSYEVLPAESTRLTN